MVGREDHYWECCQYVAPKRRHCCLTSSLMVGSEDSLHSQQRDWDAESRGCMKGISAAHAA